MKASNIIYIGLLSITLFSGCSWLNEQSHISITTTSTRAENKLHPIFLWKKSVGQGSGSFCSNLHPSLLDSRVFAANRYGMVQAIDFKTGKKIWSTNLSTPTNFFCRSVPALLSGGVIATKNVIYIGSERAKVYALNSKNGNIIWESTVDGEVCSSPAINKETVLVHTNNGLLQSIGKNDGKVKWTINLGSPLLSIFGESSPTFIFNTAIINGDNGFISAVSLNKGEIVWQKSIFELNDFSNTTFLSNIQTTPVISNKVVYSLSYNSNLMAINAHSGKMIWSCKMKPSIKIVADNSCIYLIGLDGSIIAINKDNGKILWNENKLLNHNLTSPVLYNRYIILGDSEGYLYYFNKENGLCIYKHKIDNSGFFSKPVVSANQLIIQSKNGNIYAFTY